MDYNYYVTYENMPARIKAFTVENDDQYIIVLNSRHSREQNEKSFKHELSHIINGDFNKETNTDIIEFLSHCSL